MYSYVTLHGLTRSREIVDILNKFSMGIGFKDVLKLYEGVPGVAIIDDHDFNEDTLTGSNTSHQNSFMFIQPEDI